MAQWRADRESCMDTGGGWGQESVVPCSCLVLLGFLPSRNDTPGPGLLNAVCCCFRDWQCCHSCWLLGEWPDSSSDYPFHSMQLVLTCVVSTATTMLPGLHFPGPADCSAAWTVVGPCRTRSGPHPPAPLRWETRSIGILGNSTRRCGVLMGLMLQIMPMRSSGHRTLPTGV